MNLLSMYIKAELEYDAILIRVMMELSLQKQSFTFILGLYVVLKQSIYTKGYRPLQTASVVIVYIPSHRRPNRTRRRTVRVSNQTLECRLTKL